MRTVKKGGMKTHSAKVQRDQSLSVRKRSVAGITAAEAARVIRGDTTGGHQGVTVERATPPVPLAAHEMCMVSCVGVGCD